MERTLDLLSEELPLTDSDTTGRLLCFSESQFPQFLKQRLPLSYKGLREDEVSDTKRVHTGSAVSEAYPVSASFPHGARAVLLSFPPSVLLLSLLSEFPSLHRSSPERSLPLSPHRQPPAVPSSQPPSAPFLQCQSSALTSRTRVSSVTKLHTPNTNAS